MGIEETVANVLIGYIGEDKAQELLTNVLIQNREYCITADPEDPAVRMHAEEVSKQNKELSNFIYKKIW